MKYFICDKGFYLKLAALAVPIAVQQVITVGVNMADNIMLGRLGELQMSGATLANQFIGLFQIACMGMGMGASVLTARFWGMKDWNSLKKSVVIMLRLMSAVAIVFSALTILFPGQIMEIFTNESDVVEFGITYFRISAFIYLLTGFTMTVSLILRSVGKANVPLISSIVAFAGNIFFNWIFIFGNLGAPRMEVAGAALGTLLARILEALVTGIYFFVIDERIHLKVHDLTMKCGDLLHEYFQICIPVLVSDSLLGFGNSVSSMVMGHIGASFVAANSITMVTQQLSTVVIQGVSQAGCVITGNTLGEGNKEQAQAQGVACVMLGFIIGCVGCFIIMLIKNPIINFYNISSDTKKLSGELMNAISLVVIFQSMNSILTKGVLRGGGDTRFLMIADVLFLWCASIPLGAAAGLVLHLPAFWIYLFLKIDQFIKAIWCLLRLKSGKWIKTIKGSDESRVNETSDSVFEQNENCSHTERALFMKNEK